MTKRRRRLTPREADALVAHLTPAQFRLRVEVYKEMLRFLGIEVEEMFDGMGRSFLCVELDQVRAKAPQLAADLERLREIMPEPIPHKPPTA